MRGYQSSIRQKITFVYYGTVAIVVGLSLFTFLELRFLEKKIMFGEVISEFFDTTLEVRRFEKNFFLYAKQDDYRENARYVEKARELLEKNLEGLCTIVQPERISSLSNALARYSDLMREYAIAYPDEERPTPGAGSAQRRIEKTILEGKIREAGKHIITVAEEISKTERKSLQSILYKSQRMLVLSIFSLSLLALLIGQVLSRMVVRPLKSLEGSMRQIAEGRFEKVSINSHDREIVSLTTAFNKMLKELEVRQRHLVQSEKLASLGTLLSGVAHELNNPLSNISSSCQILMEELEEADREYKRELLSQIDEQTDRARNIVRSLLEFSREKEFKKETLPLKSLFEETLRFVKGQVPTKISVTLDIPEDIAIFADKQRIQQAFLNLVKNAIEAVADEGEVIIRAKKHRAVDKTEETAEIFNHMKYRGKCTLEGDTVDIEIRDTGLGIPPEILHRVFDPFFTTKDVGKGSGLGLFIVHEIIEEHDGCIAVESERGKGTTFFISLPLKSE
ncbi:MAG: HAMP domain-containing histidine kinase [Nitrospirae bacterium]|nr:HAMP domain-containing histidine kinase [Nitrospirota bacterium]MCL5420942.1 HAMP domain-containing histidine kinase [Nitrospirota bacterium]